MPAPSRQETLRRIAVILQTNFGVEPRRVTEEATFRGAFAMDSSDIIDFIDMLEQEFGLTNDLEGYDKLHTVRHLVDFVSAQLAKPKD